MSKGLGNGTYNDLTRANHGGLKPLQQGYPLLACSDCPPPGEPLPPQHPVGDPPEEKPEERR